METKEGKAVISVSNKPVSKKMDVFYNPAMKENRDLTILLLNALGKKFRAADPFAATGVRAIRIIKEVKNLEKISINDHNPKAIFQVKKHLKLNKISGKYSISRKDANLFLLESDGFDYIDLDPFGSPNAFLDSAVKRVARDGIIAVTATDTAALTGTYANVCKRKYWAVPMRNYLMHEIALRILARKVQMIGMQYEKAIVPIYSISREHYYRIFFKCIKGKKKAEKIASNHKHVSACKQCLAVVSNDFPVEVCRCGHKMVSAGPLWTGSLWDSSLAEKIAQSTEDNMLNAIAEEAKIDAIGFYSLNKISSAVGLSKTPKPDDVVSELNKNNIPAARSHFLGDGIRTSAQPKVFASIAARISKRA